MHGAGAANADSIWQSRSPKLALPPAVVVRGRHGPNSNINGVYIRDWDFPGVCFRRGSAGSASRDIFLHYDGEWRIGPSPHEDTVWAYAPSVASSPTLIDTPWWVWDGRQMIQDARVRVSDASVIPSVLFLSFTSESSLAKIPAILRAAEGMLLQQPGLWEGRPFYRHETLEDVYLLCSAQEGRWRLGPLPRMRLGKKQQRELDDDALLFAYSASTMPQEVEVPWELPLNDGSLGGAGLEDFVVRLATTHALGGVAAAAAAPLVLGERAAHFMEAGTSAHNEASAPLQAPYGHFFEDNLASLMPSSEPTVQPLHIVVQGCTAWGGLPNGVYRKAHEPFNHRPVYHKTDAVEASALWYDSGKWWLGASIGRNEYAWLSVESRAWTPIAVAANWQALGSDNSKEALLEVTDAAATIPSSVLVENEVFVQQFRFCDARPVYQRQQEMTVATAQADLFLFFRGDESKWCLGPAIGGIDCWASAVGSRLRVAPIHLAWTWDVDKAPSPLPSFEGSKPANVADAQLEEPAAGTTQSAEAWLTSPWLWIAPCIMGICILGLTLALTYAPAWRKWRLWPSVVQRLHTSKPQPAAHPTAETGDWQSQLISRRLMDAEAQPRGQNTNDDASSVVSSRSLSSASTASRQRRSAVACVVCFDAAREVLLEPCRHVCCCKACAAMLEFCPLCRAAKSSYTEVYLFREQRRKAT